MVALHRSLRNHPLLSDPLNLPLSTPDLASRLGIDWKTNLTPAYVLDADANPRPIPGRQALVRGDNGHPLAVVGTRFTPFQNGEALDAIRKVADPEAVVTKARTYGGGEHVMVACRLPSLTATYGADRLDGFLAFSIRHGSGCVGFDMMTFRKVCSNGAMAWAAEQVAGGTRFRHTASIHGKVDSLADSYKQAIAMWAGVTEAFAAMVKRPSTMDDSALISRGRDSLSRISLAAFGITLDDIAEETERSRTIRQNKEAVIRRIRRSDTCNVDGTAGTVYADLQAVTEWINHERGEADEALFGGGADMIERATAEAYAIATA